MTERELHNKRRLNPFAFPAETDMRFTLLIVAALMLSINLSEPMIVLFAPNLDAAIYSESAQSPIGLLLTTLRFPAGLTVAIFALTTIIYRTHPGRLRRQQKLEPLSQDKDPAFYAEIQRLATVARLVPPPAIELQKGLRGQSGQAFGFRNRYVLRLDGGLRLLLRKTPAAFRAVVLHEMAHIANRDVGRTYFAQALWVAVILLTIAPIAIGNSVLLVQSYGQRILTEGLAGLNLTRLCTVSLPTLLIIFFQAAGTLLVVTAIRASLLRAREFYADERAAAWGEQASLAAIMRQNCSSDSLKRPIGLWRFHPTMQERLATLQDPSRLFRATLDLPFLVGILVAFVLGGVLFLIFPITKSIQGTSLALTSVLGVQVTDPDVSMVLNFIDLVHFMGNLMTIAFGLIPIFGIAYLISGTVGLQLQRQAVAEMAVDRRERAGYWRLWVIALLLALGLEAGFRLIPNSTLGTWVIGTSNLTNTLLTVPWLIIVTGVTWLCLVYARYFGRRVLGSHTGTSPPTWKRRWLILALSGLLLVSYLPFLASRVMITLLPIDPTDLVSSGLGWIAGTTLIVALLLYAVIFGATWIVVQTGRLLWPLRCPSCQQITRRKHAVGQPCEHCGRELAPWLFAEGVLTTGTHR